MREPGARDELMDAALIETLRFLRDCRDGHDPLCAIFLPQKECDCELVVIDAALSASGGAAQPDDGASAPAKEET